MRVYITIDTECREERVGKDGLVIPAADYGLRVWGRFANQRRPLGIELIMDELERWHLRGTFYVDPFGAHSFGFDRFSAVCSAILRRGHDIQLHAHPIQCNAKWHSQGTEPQSDFMFSYSAERQAQLLLDGIGILASCGVPRTSIVSFRAGHFSANNDTWKALKRIEMPISSNYNPCFLEKTCHIRWPRTESGVFCPVENVWELPISCFVDDNHRAKHLQISAISSDEMIHALRQAHDLGIREATIVTHSFEYCHIDSVAKRRGRPNRLTIARLRRLCRWLHANRHWLDVETVSELPRRLTERASYATPALLPSGRTYLRYLRLAEQLYQRTDRAMGGYSAL